ncbi:MULTISPECIES: OprD family porin [Pseudomonas]|uniref:OprD family porin n=1 Tax=Pseudomonas TaxID=286 RepID=UPI0015521EFC|nr:OprD family porin [Pseudomonas tumuqii]
MRKTSLALAVAAGTLGLTLSQVANAEFIKDSKASLEARNFYFNRDFREGTGQAKQEEWAQGFLLRMESGYTEGSVGFGVDALATFGFKLDSGDGTAGSGLLVPDRSSGGSQDNSGGLGLTAKAKAGESVLKVGSLQLKNQAIGSSDSRLLPQVFRGGNIVSKDIAGLTLDAGYLDEVNNRNSSDYEDMTLNTFALSGITVSGVNQSNEFVFAGGNYKLSDSLTGGYYYSNLEDMYKQHSFNLVHVLPIADKQSLKTDLRYARSTDDGSSNIDNKAFGAMFTYALSGHSLGLGYQKMSGDTGFAYVGGTDPFLVNYVQIGNFAAKDETSWQARYDFNFASIGIPGLTFMTRYLTGDNIDRGAASDGKEWERNMDIAYVVQEGALKNLGVKWRNATMRNNFGRDIDENRLIVSYTLPLF